MSPKDCRDRARDILSGNWRSAIGVTFLAHLVGRCCEQFRFI